MSATVEFGVNDMPAISSNRLEDCASASLLQNAPLPTALKTILTSSMPIARSDWSHCGVGNFMGFRAATCWWRTKKRSVNCVTSRTSSIFVWSWGDVQHTRLLPSPPGLRKSRPCDCEPTPDGPESLLRGVIDMKSLDVTSRLPI